MGSLILRVLVVGLLSATSMLLVELAIQLLNHRSASLDFFMGATGWLVGTLGWILRRYVWRH